MSAPVLRKLKVSREDKARLLDMKDLFRFQAPTAHVIPWDGDRLVNRDRVLGLLMRWAKLTGAQSAPTEAWSRRKLVQIKANISVEHADGRNPVELGVMVNHALDAYFGEGRRPPTGDGIGRAIRSVDRFVRLPFKEVEDIWWEALRTRADPRDVLTKRMGLIVEDAIAVAKHDATMVDVTFPSGPHFESRFGVLEEIASDNGRKADRYLEEAAMREAVRKWGRPESAEQ